MALSEMERKQEAPGSLSEPNVAPGNSRYAVSSPVPGDESGVGPCAYILYAYFPSELRGRRKITVLLRIERLFFYLIYMSWI